MSPLQTMGLVGALLAAGLAVYYLGVAREEAEQLRESLHIGTTQTRATESALSELEKSRREAAEKEREYARAAKAAADLPLEQRFGEDDRLCDAIDAGRGEPAPRVAGRLPDHGQLPGGIAAGRADDAGRAYVDYVLTVEAAWNACRDRQRALRAYVRRMEALHDPS